MYIIISHCKYDIIPLHRIKNEPSQKKPNQLNETNDKSKETLKWKVNLVCMYAMATFERNG